MTAAIPADITAIAQAVKDSLYDRVERWDGDPDAMDLLIADIASALQAERNRATEAERERAAKVADDLADLAEHDANQTEADWTGSDLSFEERKANRSYARERRAEAAVYRKAAAAIRNQTPVGE